MSLGLPVAFMSVILQRACIPDKVKQRQAKLTNGTVNQVLMSFFFFNHRIQPSPKDHSEGYGGHAVVRPSGSQGNLGYHAAE